MNKVTKKVEEVKKDATKAVKEGTKGMAKTTAKVGEKALDAVKKTVK